MDPSYDGELGTAGGAAFGAALRGIAETQELGDAASLGEASGLDESLLERVFSGEARLAVPALARLARALRLRPIEFLQKTGLLSLEVYAFGLDPLYFLPEGQIRYDARIYMREINPRHPVPEGDMTKRNPTLKALAADEILDPLGKLEIELAYLLRGAIQGTDGRL
ncbi:MAG: hypothetical protein JO359_10665 [Candidatus Eremiobacteraeota bacterium]|nr:hypothetical protein [Candidatus Eremiobacteraeota bacterium]